MSDELDRGRPAFVTVGHSTRSLEEFIALLKSDGVQFLADVRTVPRSRHNPQFNRDTLPEALKGAGIEYESMQGLGGLRRPRKDSPNSGWRNEGFRGYADYMETPEFDQQLRSLVEMAGNRRVALMCAEAVPWRCHRSLLADALTVRGFQVAEIIGNAPARPHKVTPWAHVEGTSIRYPPETSPDDQ